MVTIASAFTDGRYAAPTGVGFDGVVRVSSAGYYGTGVLLYDGRAVLTAGHLFSYGNTAATIHFDTTGGAVSLNSSQVLVHPDYVSTSSNYDLALVWLSGSAPVSAERYDLYRSGDEQGQTFTFLGYGKPGTGALGVSAQADTGYVRRQAENTFDADGAQLKAAMGSAMAWSPLQGSQLMADFDNGQWANDALGRLLGVSHTGLGLNEGLIAVGDSGGPAFIDGRVAGIASYTATLSRGAVHPDIDDTGNSSFGELAAWQRAGYFQDWIDQGLRARYTDAPTRPDDVKKSVVEPDSGTAYVYFLLQFNGVRSAPDQWLSVDYTTRDGSATAGSDYLPRSGTLVLYPEENQAVIAVEVVGDTVAEPDETFYLDVFNPVGGSFGAGVTTLTAMRTIVNDDGMFFG